MNQSKKILVIQPLPGIGDMIWYLPLIHAIAAFEKTPITLLCKKRAMASEIFVSDNSVSNIITLQENPGQHGLFGVIRFVRLLKRHRFDKVWILHNSRLYLYASKVAGISECNQFRIPPHTSSFPPRDRLRAFENTTGITPEYEPRLFPNSDATKLILKKYQTYRAPWIGIGIGSSEEWKKWGCANFASLIDQISRQQKATFFLMGGKMDTADARQIQNLSQCHDVVIATDNTLRESIALVSKCDLFIGNDSGLLNIAGALKKPCIGLFGATSPLPCYPTLRAIQPSSSKLKMQGIEVEEVSKLISRQVVFE